MALFWSCSGDLEPKPALNNETDQVALESRNAHCSPQGVCDSPFNFSMQFSGSASGQPCSVIVEMIITVCGSDYNYQELSITPIDPGCIFTQADLDATYNRFIEIYMDLYADVVPCSAGISTLSNYIKKNCVQLCQSFNGDGQAPTYYMEPCGQIGGCCIETTEWCEANGDPTKIEFHTNTISGDCIGVLNSGCLFPGSREGCISDRCEE